MGCRIAYKPGLPCQVLLVLLVLLMLLFLVLTLLSSVQRRLLLIRQLLLRLQVQVRSLHATAATAAAVAVSLASLPRAAAAALGRVRQHRGSLEERQRQYHGHAEPLRRRRLFVQKGVGHGRWLLPQRVGRQPQRRAPRDPSAAQGNLARASERLQWIVLPAGRDDGVEKERGGDGSLDQGVVETSLPVYSGRFTLYAGVSRKKAVPCSGTCLAV